MSRQASAITAKDDNHEKDVEKQDIDKTQSESDVEVTIEGEEEIKRAETKREDDDVPALRKQLEDLRKSEEIAKRDAEENARRLREAEAAHARTLEESQKHRLNSEQSQLDAVENALGAAESEAAAAERDIQAAIEAGDPKAQALAYRALAKAQTNIARLEDGKIELEGRIEASKAERTRAEEARKTEPPQRQDAIESLQVPDRAKEWLRGHREFAENPRKNAQLQIAHFDAVEEGHKEFSTAYFSAVERLLGLNKKEEEVDNEEPEVEVETKPKRSAPIVSAPVSRETSSNGGNNASRTKIKLTREQAEFAKMAGITTEEYAKQLLKLRELKQQGIYGESR